MKAIVYCIASAKGGSGKTMLTASMARFLSSVGKKCLIIDCDPATHGMTLLYTPEAISRPGKKMLGLFDNLHETAAATTEVKSRVDFGAAIASRTVVSLEDGVDLLPGTFDLSRDPFGDEHVHAALLADLVAAKRPNYDVIFLDVQAGAEPLTRVAMRKSTADQVIIVSEYDPMSAMGVERLKKLAGEDLDYSRTWTLLNKLLPEFAEVYKDFLIFARYLPPVPWQADVVRAYAKQKLALDLDNGNDFTLAIMRTVGTLLGEEIEDEIAKWSSSKAYALKAPLERQYKDAEQELSVALSERNRVARQRRIRLMLQVYGMSFVVLLTFSLMGLFPQAWKMLLGPFGELPSSIAAGGVMALLMPIFIWGAYWGFRNEKTAETLRYDRVIAMLEERLKQLELLRSADYETIVKLS